MVIKQYLGVRVMAEKTFKEKVKKVFKQEFPEDTVDVSDGYRDNVHVVIVSRKLD